MALEQEFRDSGAEAGSLVYDILMAPYRTFVFLWHLFID
jgi:hypothetical protein